MNEVITVVVPVYRVEKFLKRCIDSILSQSYTNLDIVLVDDGSDDKCPEICDSYAEKDKRIRVIHKENGGLSDARNAGIEVAKGKLITFVDSDDSIDSDYVKQLYETIIREKADISICGYTVFYDNGRTVCNSSNKKMTLNPKETLEKMLYQEDFNVSTWAKLYKTELFSGIRFPKGENYEDSSTTYRLVMKSNKIACNMKSQYKYMIRSDSILTAPFSEKKLLLIKSYERMGKEVVDKYPELAPAATRGETYARISTLRQMISCRPARKDIERKLRREILQHKKQIINDKRCCKRDKIAVLILLLGIGPFKISWKMYCRVTGRNM